MREQMSLRKAQTDQTLKRMDDGRAALNANPPDPSITQMIPQTVKAMDLNANRPILPLATLNVAPPTLPVATPNATPPVFEVLDDSIKPVVNETYRLRCTEWNQTTTIYFKDLI